MYLIHLKFTWCGCCYLVGLNCNCCHIYFNIRWNYLKKLYLRAPVKNFESHAMDNQSSAELSYPLYKSRSHILSQHKLTNIIEVSHLLNSLTIGWFTAVLSSERGNYKNRTDLFPKFHVHKIENMFFKKFELVSPKK